MKEAAGSILAKRRVMRIRKSKFPAPLRDCTQQQVSIMHPALLAPGRESAVAFLNAEHAALDGRSLGLAIESWADRAGAAPEVGRKAPGRQPGDD